MFNPAEPRGIHHSRTSRRVDSNQTPQLVSSRADRSKRWKGAVVIDRPSRVVIAIVRIFGGIVMTR